MKTQKTLQILDRLPITFEREVEDIKTLIDLVKDYMDKDTIIINCRPEISSIACQMLNHKLSHLNKDELFPQYSLFIPDKGMNMVFDSCTGDYRGYDKYLFQWVAENISTNSKYLFVDVRMNNNYTKLRSIIRDKSMEYRFATLYGTPEAKADYMVKEIEKKPLFQWENIRNVNY